MAKILHTSPDWTRFPIIGDFHTHSMYSKHGMCSIDEIVTAAYADPRIRYVAITDHFWPLSCGMRPDDGIPATLDQIESANQEARLWEIPRRYQPSMLERPMLTNDGVKARSLTVLPGYEYSVIPYRNNSMTASNLYALYNHTEDMLKHSCRHVRIMSVHTWYLDPKNSNFTDILTSIAEMGLRNFDILGHPDRDLDKICEGYDADPYTLNTFYHDLIEMMMDNEILLELNEESCRDPKYTDMIKTWLNIAKELRAMIVVNTDSHSRYAVAKFKNAMAMLDAVEFPPDLILNIDDEKIKERFIK